MTEDNTPSIFLSYAREDLKDARRVYDFLISAGAKVWFDQEKLPPGSNWKSNIRTAIRDTRYFVALLSDKSVSKRGFVQAEIGNAIESLAEFPDNEIYLIPVRLNDCEPTHPKLCDLSWLDLFPDWHLGLHRLTQAFNLPTVICSGLYVSRPIFLANEVFKMYLRFYDDGTVVSCRSTGGANELASWFGRYHELSTKTTYTTTSGQIEFVGAGFFEFLTYKGHIVGRDLELRWHSKKTNTRGVQSFKWIDWVEGQDGDQAANRST